MSTAKNRRSFDASSQDEIFSSNSNYALFVGKNFNYYFSKWGQLLNDKCEGDLDILRKSRINQVSWNIWALVFGFVWLAYRKMYLLSVIALAVTCFVPWIGWLQCLALGLYGNRMYFQFVDKKVQNLEKQIQNPDILKAEIINSGSTSKLGAFFAIVVMAIFISVLPSAKKSGFKNSSSVPYSVRNQINSIPFTFGFNTTDTKVQDIVANLAGSDGKVEWKKDGNNFYIHINNQHWIGYLKFSYNESTDYIFLSETQVKDKAGINLCSGFGANNSIECLGLWLSRN